MWAVLGSFGIELTRILHSCEFVKLDPPTVPNVIRFVGGLLFLLVAVGKR